MTLRDAVTCALAHSPDLEVSQGHEVLDAESALLTSQSLLSQAARSVETATLALDLSVARIDITRLPER